MSATPPDEYMVTTVLVVIRRASAVAVTLWMAVTAVWAVLALVGSPDVVALAALLPLLAVQTAMYIVLGRFARWWWRFPALIIGAVTVFVVVLVMGMLRPDLVGSGGFPAAGPAMALVALATLPATARSGIRCSIIALVLALVAELTARMTVGLEPLVSIEPIVVAAVLQASLVALAVRRRNQSRRSHVEVALAERTLADRDARIAEERATALIHDTLLGDLAALAAWEGALATEQRRSLERDAARAIEVMARPRPDEVTTSDAPGEGSGSESEATGGERDAPADDAEAVFHRLLREVQWEGLAVSLSGEVTALAEIAPGARASLLLAVRAALMNVREHAGIDAADVSIIADGSWLQVMVSDGGHGFDLEEVGKDRLGLRTSIEQRLEHVGGSASVWSSPGIGTSVLLRVPLSGGARVGEGASGTRVGADEGAER